MQKQQIWKHPPFYSGYRHNKRILAAFAIMVQGLAAICDNKTVARRLTNIRRKLEYCFGCQSHADVQFFVNIIFDDFLNVRDAMEQRETDDLESAMCLLETDIKKLTDLIRDDVAVAPWSDELDHRVSKLIENTASIRTIYKRTVDDLRRMRNKRDKISAELLTAEMTVTESERMELRERRLITYCDLREQALKSLEDILDELEELATLAHNIPALAGKANRRIKIKYLADFYVHPFKAQAQREKLKGELLFIIKSVEKASDMTNTWESLMYGEEQTTAENPQHVVKGEASSQPEGIYVESDSRRNAKAQIDLTDKSSSNANKITAKGD